MIRTLFVITFLLGMAYSVHGQKDKVLRGFSELNAKNYGLALKIFHELKDNNPSISNYGMALLYGETLDFKQIDLWIKEIGSSPTYLESFYRLNNLEKGTASKLLEDFKDHLKMNPEAHPHFSAFKDITAQVQATGNGTYTLSDLDLTAEIPQYFQNRTNFGGWAIIVVYQNDALPLNQLNIYDGMQAVPSRIDISLNSLNVIDNFDAKIGFLAWEGDVGIANNESLTINGNVLSNPPLNPSNNAFNSTNSVTGSNTLYNMDLDIYNIQNNINVGDTTADISLTSNQDYVMINAIVTKLNSQLPDATIVLNNYSTECNTGVIEVDYTVYNVNSTEFLPANTPITFYVQNTVLGTFFTQNDIPIGGNESGSVLLNIPSALSTNFTLLAVVDDSGNGTGIVTELVETNNTFEALIDLKISPTL